MAQKVWQVTKKKYCEHVHQEVDLETQVIYPADHLPDQPRIAARRCSKAVECNLEEKANCVYCGTNPDYDPV
jgi:hypothetical protein